MNVPAAIEIAFAEILKVYGNTGAGTVVRCFQTLSDEQALALTGKKSFPMIDIRCGSPATDDQVTRYCDVVMLCATYNEDDKNHLELNKIYTSVQNVCDQLHDNFMDGSGDVYNTFVASIGGNTTDHLWQALAATPQT